MNIQTIRNIHKARLTQALDRAFTRAGTCSGTWGIPGMPENLKEIGAWLYLNGCDDAATDAETTFGFSPDAYRDYGRAVPEAVLMGAKYAEMLAEANDPAGVRLSVRKAR